jgi:hypothetical protein
VLKAPAIREETPMPDANMTFRLNHAAPGGGTTAPSIPVVAPFEGAISGQIDVPDEAANDTVYAVPFGTIASPTAVMIENKTGQDLGVRINGAVADEFQLPDGGVFAYAAPAAAAAVPIDELAVVTTAAQVGAGKVNFWIVGDPVEEA